MKTSPSKLSRYCDKAHLLRSQCWKTGLIGRARYYKCLACDAYYASFTKAERHETTMKHQRAFDQYILNNSCRGAAPAASSQVGRTDSVEEYSGEKKTQSCSVELSHEPYLINDSPDRSVVQQHDPGALSQNHETINDASIAGWTIGRADYVTPRGLDELWRGLAKLVRPHCNLVPQTAENFIGECREVTRIDR